MAKLSREQAASYLYNAGFRGDDLVKMVAIMGRESNYTTDAHRTDQKKSALSGDRGLMQINYVHDQGLIDAGLINSKADLFDPATNAAAAFHLYQQGGLSPWTAGKGGWTKGGDPLYGTDYARAASAVQNYTANPSAYGSGSGPGGTVPAKEPEVVERNTEYDPTYTPPERDPKMQQGLTTLLGRFGIEYPDAPRATPQLLALMRGLGMTLDTAEDIQRVQKSRIEGRSADSMADIARSDERRRGSITSGLQQANVLSSGAANTRYARQAENVLASQADVQRKRGDALADSENQLAITETSARQSALERLLSEEEKQATTEATAKERVSSFERQREEADFQYEREKAARDAYLATQVGAYGGVG